MSNSQDNQFYESDLDLDSMTLVLKSDLDMVKMYHHTKNEVSMSRHSKVIARTDRQTHRPPHTRAVRIPFMICIADQTEHIIHSVLLACTILLPFQWRIYIQKFPARPSQQDQILSFLHMFSPKSACVGGWHPLQQGLVPPQWEILDPPLHLEIRYNSHS